MKRSPSRCGQGGKRRHVDRDGRRLAGTLRRRVAKAVAALALLPVLLLGCLALGERAERWQPREGIDRWSVRHGQARSTSGCAYDYRVFEPSGAGADPLAAVMLGHGFLRDQDTLIDLASALADAGLRAITLDFCNMRPWNGHHRRNADDLLALAEREALPGRTVYAGFSAGALAALLAAADDPSALGVLTLDLVDQAGLGEAAARRLQAPLVGFAGPDSACNANGNGAAAFSAIAAPLQLIEGASHCEFESPTNWLCEIACGDETPLPTDPAARAAAVDEATIDAGQRRTIIASTRRALQAMAVR